MFRFCNSEFWTESVGTIGSFSEISAPEKSSVYSTSTASSTWKVASLIFFESLLINIFSASSEMNIVWLILGAFTIPSFSETSASIVPSFLEIKTLTILFSVEPLHHYQMIII